MTLYYEAGLVVASSPLDMTCTVAGFAASVASGYYAHQTLASCTINGVTVPSVTSYTALGVAVKTALDAAGGGPYTVTHSATTHLYTISRATTFTLNFSGGAANTRLAHALGFTSTNHTGANSYTSDVRPYYVIVPTEAGRMGMLPFLYEPEDIVETAMSDGGTPYSTARNTNEAWSDWTQPFEAKAACYDTAALAAAPWTWQMFFRHTRGTRPFAVYESTLFNAVYKNRPEGARWKITPVNSDLDTLYNLAFHAYYVGAL